MPYKDPEQKKRHEREYNQLHRKEIREREREYEKTHKEEIAERKRAWVRSNLERKRATWRHYYERNKGKLIAYKHEWYLQHREHVKKVLAEYNLKLKREVMAHYGGKCACCGESRIEFLAIDHVNGGGRKHLQSIGISGGSNLYKWLRNHDYPNDPPLQALCANCNTARYFYGSCPHTRIA